METLDLIIKPSTQNLGKDDPHLYTMAGNLITYISSEDWKNQCGFEPVISDRMKQVYAILRIDPSLKPLIHEMIQEDGDFDSDGKPIYNTNYRRHKGIFVLDKLVSLIPNSADLIAKWQGDDVVDIIDARSISNLADNIELSSNHNPSEIHVIDRNVITSGTPTVGSGGDYTNWDAWADDVNDLTDNMIASMISNTTEATIINISFDIGTYTLQTTSNSPHNGDVTQGYIASINQDGDGFRQTGAIGTGKWECLNFTIKRTTAGSTAAQALITRNQVGVANIEIHDLFIDGNNLEGRLFDFESNNNCEAWNIVGWDAGSDGLFDGGQFRNCTIYNCVSNQVDAQSNTHTYDNVLCLNGTSVNYQSISSSTGRNTGSSDATNENGDWSTGTNNVSNLTVSNEIYTDDTQSNFANVKNLGSAWNGGNGNHFSSTDMKGVSWDTENPSIGAFQFVSSNKYAQQQRYGQKFGQFYLNN